jgi:hypothetical protein
MADFKGRFDAQIAVANSAAANNTTALQAHAIGIHPNHVRRMLENISKLLGIVDRKGHKHPEFLAATPTIIPERAIELVSSIKPNFDAGIESFIQNVLPQLVEVEDKLIKAVGVSALRTADIKNSQVRAINQILDRAQIQGNEATNIAKAIREENKEIGAEKERLIEVLEAASADRKKIEEIAKQAEKLARGNSSQNALENLVRTARSKSDEINDVLTSVKASQEAAATAAKMALDSSEKSKTSLDGLDASDKKAFGILNNVTQAGLAGAYKTEREHLQRQQDRFSLVFYGIIISVIVYAAIFILPIVSKILTVNGATDLAVKENALLLLVRFLIVTPAIWALIFTNKRYVTLEALQMDYAAKASTALAYSGYRDEMGDDVDLSKRLKDGLLMRFLEHPSRLLGSRVDDHKDFGFSGEDTRQNSKNEGKLPANDESGSTE